jgi:hypothetical protein
MQPLHNKDIPDNAKRPPMEIAFNTENDCFAFRDTLLKVRPLPCEFNGGLDGLGASVHWQYHVIPKHLSDLLGKASEDAVIERTRRKSELLRLRH